ncbi:unnamed protein product, partial [Cyprideis torosa]
MPFGRNSPHPVGEIITNDLARTGQFNPVDPRAFPQYPESSEQIDWEAWRVRDIFYVVVGRVAQNGVGWELQYELIDTANKTVVSGLSYPRVGERDLRRAAHQIADRILKDVTGLPGAFDSRLAYVSRIGRGESATYRLVVADSDGYGPETVLTSRGQPILSPDWSPDGRRIAYTLFNGIRRAIWVHDIVSNNRYKIAEYKGINGAPSWSPDGQQLAVSLSRDGSPDIYLVNANGANLRKIASVPRANDTEPCWSSDGSTLYFVSDRGGTPQ